MSKSKRPANMQRRPTHSQIAREIRVSNAWEMRVTTLQSENTALKWTVKAITDFRPVLLELEGYKKQAELIAGMTSFPDHRVLDAMRPHASQIARNLSAWFTTWTETIRREERIFGPFFSADEIKEIGADISHLIDSLQAFSTGEDNGAKLRAWFRQQSGLVDLFERAIAKTNTGGRTPNRASDWIGEQLTTTQEQSETTQREAVEQIYRRLIRHEHDGTLTPIEKKALAELDSRDGGNFRDRGLLLGKTFDYARQTIRNKRGNSV